MEIGKIIKGTRNYLGLKQSELAKLLGVTRSYISLLENGKVKRPNKIVEKSIFNLLSSFNLDSQEIVRCAQLNLKEIIKFIKNRLNLSNSQFSRLILNTSVDVLNKIYEKGGGVVVKKRSRLIKIYYQLKNGEDARRILLQLGYENILKNPNGVLLYFLRKKLGLTQLELCKRLRLSPGTAPIISELELGYRPLSNQRFKEILNKLGIKKFVVSDSLINKYLDKWRLAQKYPEIIGFRNSVREGTEFEEKIAEYLSKKFACTCFTNCILSNENLEIFNPDIYLILPPWRIVIEAKDRRKRNITLERKKIINGLRYIIPKFPFIDFFIIVTPDDKPTWLGDKLFLIGFNSLKDLRKIISDKKEPEKEKIIELRRSMQLTYTQLASLLKTSASMLQKVKKTGNVPLWLEKRIKNLRKRIKGMSKAQIILEANKAKNFSKINGPLLAFLRRELGISQNELAKRVGCKKSELSGYEKNRVSWKSLEKRIWQTIKKIAIEKSVNYQKLLSKAKQKLRDELERWECAKLFGDVVNLYRVNPSTIQYNEEFKIFKIFKRAGFTVLQNVEVMGKTSTYEVDVYAIKKKMRIICEVKRSIRRQAELIRDLSFKRKDLKPNYLFLVCYGKFNRQLKEKFMKEEIILLSPAELKKEVEKIAI